MFRLISPDVIDAELQVQGTLMRLRSNKGK